MAITNNRTYDAQATLVKGVALGGATRINVQEGFGKVSRTRFDGRTGTHAIKKLEKFTRFTISTFDVTKLLTVLNAAPADADDYVTFYDARDGVSPVTFVKHDLIHPVFTSASLRVPESGPASMELAGECRWVDENQANLLTDFHEVHALTTGVALATVQALLTAPTLLEEVIAAALGATSIAHRNTFSLRIDGQVRRDRNHGAGGPDSIVWVPDTARFDMGHKDQNATGTPVKSTQQILLDAGTEDLAVTLGLVNGSANQVITLKNATAIEAPGEHPFDSYGSFTPSGECVWVDDDGTTFRTLGGASPLITIADE